MSYVSIYAQHRVSFNLLYPLRFINPAASFSFDLGYQWPSKNRHFIEASLRFNGRILDYERESQSERFRYLDQAGIRFMLKTYSKPGLAKGFFTAMLSDLMIARTRHRVTGSNPDTFIESKGLLFGLGFGIGRSIHFNRIIIEPQAGIGMAILSPALYPENKAYSFSDWWHGDSRKLLLNPSFISFKIGYLL